MLFSLLVDFVRLILTVFNRKDYPDFADYLINNYSYLPEERIRLRLLPIEELKENEHYKEWVRLIGGVKNVFLRELIKDKKLA